MPFAPGVSVAGADVIITITGNTVRGGSVPGILVTSTSGLRLESNHPDLHGSNPHVARLLRQAGLPPDAPIARIQCEP